MTARTVVALAALAALGSRPVATPAQTYPGQPTQARVFVENHGAHDAVPVTVEGVAGDAPIKTHIVGTPAVSIASPAIFEMRRARQAWEYHRVTTPPDEDPTLELNRLGRDGWELTTQYVTPRGSIVAIVKRPAPAR